MSDERAFEVGRNLAVTPGQRRLPQRADRADPVRADDARACTGGRSSSCRRASTSTTSSTCSPTNSFVRWAVGAGPHGVHDLVAQHPAGARPAHLGRLPRAGRADGASASRSEIAGSKTVNALGFCVGGTLLACALAVLAARGDRSVESVDAAHDDARLRRSRATSASTCRASSSPRASRRCMAGQRMHGSELAGAFASLRANDLVWNYVVNNYLKGETPPAFDLLLLERRLGEPAGTDVRLLPAQHVPRQQAARARRADDGRRADRPRARSTMPAYVVRLARRPHRAVALGLPVDARCSAATSRSCWARPATSPASSIRRRRTGATTGRTELVTDDADDWLARARRAIREAGGRTGARGSRAHGGALARRAARARATPRHPPLEPAPGRYVREPSG